MMALTKDVIMIKYDETLEMFLVNTVEMLDNLMTRQEDLEDLIATRFEDHETNCMYTESDVVDELISITGLKKIESNNTCNYDNDLDQDFNYTILASDRDEWFYSNKIMIVLRLHQGGDIRGNYGKCMIFELDADQSHYFNESMQVGFYSEEYEQDHGNTYEAGYYRNPQYQFNEDFKIYGIRKMNTKYEYILVKNKYNNKRYKFYACGAPIY